jgi:HEAT repeat protein
MTAADALIEIGDIAVTPLIESLSHEKVNVRCRACVIAGRRCMFGVAGLSW